MSENQTPKENFPANDGKIPVPMTRPVSENSDFDESAEIHSFPRIETRNSVRDRTASDLARLIVRAFCASIALSFIFVFVHYSTQLIYQFQSEKEEVVIDVNASLEIFKTVSAVMSGPLGFVLGFYFRESD